MAPAAHDLPGWVLDLIAALEQYEQEHPPLYRYVGPPDGSGKYEHWCCPGPLLTRVPDDALTAARAYARGKTDATQTIA